MAVRTRMMNPANGIVVGAKLTHHLYFAASRSVMSRVLSIACANSDDGEAVAVSPASSPSEGDSSFWRSVNRAKMFKQKVTFGLH